MLAGTRLLSAACVPSIYAYGRSHFVNCQTHKEEVLGVEFPDFVKFSDDKKTKPRQVYVASAPRCINDLCWVKALRAYSLGLYVDEGAISKAKDVQQLLGTETEKTLVFKFPIKRDRHHSVKGFERALSLSKPTNTDGEDVDEKIQQYVRIIKRLPFETGNAVLSVTLVADPPKVQVRFATEGESDPALVGEVEGRSIVKTFHNLYIQNAETHEAGRQKKMAEEYARGASVLLTADT